MKSILRPLRDRAGNARGTLVVSELPGGPPLAMSGPAAILEGQRYRYELVDLDGVVRIEPAELFEPDDLTLRQGRILPGQSVGSLVVVVQCEDIELSTSVEVVPTKLSQTDEYRRMLVEITRHAAEAVLQGFATSIRAAAGTESADLLYQRFAVLDSALRSEEFSAAIGRIFSDPHLEWLPIRESRNPGSSYPAGSAFSKALAASGPRQPWLTGRGRVVLATIPTTMEQTRHESTLDTAPNRFVKYVLQNWRALAQQLRDNLTLDDITAKPGPVRRGLHAADHTLEALDEVLSRPLFRQVGPLDHVTTSNQVLLKREDYRQLMHMFVLVEAGLELPFSSGADDVYNPSLRNVAKLYELWSYLTLVEVVGRLCGKQQTAQAFTPSANGLSLQLGAGAASALRWRTDRRSRPLEVLLTFNRHFGKDESWTAPMRPDCSIFISPLGSTPGEAAGSLGVWVHFDAKYRVSAIQPIDLSAEDDDEVVSRGTAKRDDLLKMHAYRDAIRRTAGAYILYPGDMIVDQREFTETLPGLGAFPLRPGANETHGVEAISTFLDDVLDHVAEQASQHERERFWRARIYATPTPNQHLSPSPFLDRPPADTDVLVAYVRGSRHRAWIEQNRSYNVRADDRTGSLRLGSRELSAGLVLLYEQVGGAYRIITLARTGEWRAVSKQELIDTGYPEPRGRLYLVTTLTAVPDLPRWLADISINALQPRGLVRAAPFAVTWLDLMASVQPT
jgi:hypothetical protein